VDILFDFCITLFYFEMLRNLCSSSEKKMKKFEKLILRMFSNFQKKFFYE